MLKRFKRNYLRVILSFFAISALVLLLLADDYFRYSIVSMRLSSIQFALIPFAAISILGIFVEEKAYSKWFYFSIVWIPLQISIFLYLFWFGMGGDFAGIAAGYNALSVLFVTVIYILISAYIFKGGLRRGV